MVTFYHQVKVLENVYLEDSFVLTIDETENSIEFDLEVVLTETHSAYRPPEPDQQYCYRNAKLRFSDCRSIVWKRKHLEPSYDADGSIDYGNIDSFYGSSGTYYLTGDWGEIEIETSTLAFFLTNWKGC